MTKLNNNQLYQLYTYYSSQNNIQNSGIYRYRFQTDANVFMKILEFFLPESEQTHCSGLGTWFASIFIIWTKQNLYYCNFFVESARSIELEKKTCFVLFNEWLQLNGISYEFYIEDSTNTEYYNSTLDVTEYNSSYSDEVESFKAKPRYSYWQWLCDIQNSVVKYYILLDSARISAEKNIYLWRPFLVELVKESNFYFIEFWLVKKFMELSILENVLLECKKMTLRSHYRQYYRLVNNKTRFKSYWDYNPNVESYFPINLIGLIDCSLHFNFFIYYTQLNIDKTDFEKIYNLFDNQFHQFSEIEFVLMYKRKGDQLYTLLLITNTFCLNTLEKLLNQSINSLDSFAYNFYSVEEEDYEEYFSNMYSRDEGCRRILIEINSLVVGIYSRNQVYFMLCYCGFSGGLYDSDFLCFALEEGEDCQWFRSERDRDFISNYFGFSYYGFVRSIKIVDKKTHHEISNITINTIK